jgi:hypothetical protein
MIILPIQDQLQKYFACMKECVEFAEAADEPYTDKHVLSKALAIINYGPPL